MATPESREPPVLRVGMPVRICIALRDGISQTGAIYDYLPHRPWPWHVRPDNWDARATGIAFTEDELTPLTER